jgi:dipeptidyl aminopeptidase/acylaminoacyl peptidase
MKPSNGATPEQSFYASKDVFKDSRSWSPDGKSLVFEQLDPKTNRDLWILTMEGSPTPKPYLQTSFNETFGLVSPDGRWLAYLSDETGQNEVFVDAFPTPRSKSKISDHGAAGVVWKKDGRELAVFGADGRSIFTADVTATGDFHASPLRPMVTLPKGTVGAMPTPDFQRVLVATPVNESTQSTLTLVFDWWSALPKK